MELKVEGRNLEINGELRGQLERKLAAVERHLPAAGEATVEVTYERTRAQGERVLVQAAVSVKGQLLRAEQRGPTATAAINAAVDSLNLAAARYKGRAYRSSRARQRVSVGRQQANDRDELDRELARQGAGELELEAAAR